MYYFKDQNVEVIREGNRADFLPARGQGFELLEGARRGSELLLSGGFLYYFSKSSEDWAYFACREKSCSGSGQINRNNGLFYIIKEHDHNNDSINTDKMKLIADLKLGARSSLDGLREVFDRTCRAYSLETARLVTFQEQRENMRRSRLAKYPPTPKTRQDLSLVLGNSDIPELIKHYKGAIYNEQGNLAAIAFFDDGAHEFLSGEKHMCFDGTFYTVPNLFCQLFVCHFNKGPKFIPALYFLMDSKSVQSYKSVFLYILENFPNLTILTSMSDFESSSRIALQQHFPTTVIYGCYFHFKQCIVRKLGAENLKSLFCNDEIFKMFINSICATAFLLPQDISATFESIVSNYNLAIA